MNYRCGGNNIHEGCGAGTVGAHGKVMTASSIMDIAGTWFNKFGEEQLKATLKDVQYNPKVKHQLVQYWKSNQRRWEAYW